MSNITVTYRDGRVAQLEQVYIRGSKIRFLILPDMLKNAPMLKSVKNKNQGAGAGRGKAAILKAQGKARRRSSHVFYNTRISDGVVAFIYFLNINVLQDHRLICKWAQSTISLENSFLN